MDFFKMDKKALLKFFHEECSTISKLARLHTERYRIGLGVVFLELRAGQKFEYCVITVTVVVYRTQALKLWNILHRKILVVLSCPS